MLESHGFENGRYIDLTFGAIRIYSAQKPTEWQSMQWQTGGEP